MPSATDERSPRKNHPPSPPAPPPLLNSPNALLPSTGGKAPSPSRFSPKYVPRLMVYDLSEYQEDHWRE